jgi:hypothetical protein
LSKSKRNYCSQVSWNKLDPPTKFQCYTEAVYVSHRERASLKMIRSDLEHLNPGANGDPIGSPFKCKSAFRKSAWGSAGSKLAVLLVPIGIEPDL